MTHHPKISIVTPSFNDVKYLETTILSVIRQGYPNLEYVIIDGGSTDGSIEIIKKYQDRLAYWTSEKDEGMYSAIQKGFGQCTGEIMGWLNSDDILHPNSLFTLSQIFGDFANVKWIQGFPNSIDETGRIVHVSSPLGVDKFFFHQKKHGQLSKFIQQESTFWRRSLWEKAGGYLDTNYKYAGDFELWIRFFEHEKLYNIHALLGSFRLSAGGQASQDHYEEYLFETIKILKQHPLTEAEQKQIKRVKILELLESKWTRLIKKVKNILQLNHESVMNNRIQFDYKTQKFKMK